MLKKRLTRKKRWIIVGIVMVVYVAGMSLLPTPNVVVERLVQDQSIQTGTAKDLPWPAAQQVAVGALGYGVLAAKGDGEALPMASVAKAVAALAIVREHPLKQGESGPTITITQEDVDIFDYYYLNDGSTVPVKVGQEFTQYEALQAMLIPSANNMAVTTARWAFGSEEAYIEQVNSMLKDMGLSKTHIADPSGFSEETVSTARELVSIGEAVLAEPVLAEIVAQSEANIPGGLVHNVNNALGLADINGIKTGFTQAAGGCLLFSATRDIAGKPTTVVGAILGAQTRPVALAAAPKLVNASFPNFVDLTPLDANQAVAMAKIPWAADIPFTLDQEVKYVAWKGEQQELKVAINDDTYEARLTFGGKESVAKLASPIPAPNILWRLTHPVEMLGLKRAQ